MVRISEQFRGRPSPLLIDGHEALIRLAGSIGPLARLPEQSVPPSGDEIQALDRLELA